jgi:hypothetical protein
MKTWMKVLIVTVLVAVPAFLAEPNGPLGSFWAPHPEGPVPTDAQLPLFMLMGVLEAVTFGTAIAFLLFGYPLVEAIGSASRSLAHAAQVSIAWLLGNWWAHDSLHMHVGDNTGALLAIEYGFHVTLMIAGAVLAIFFVKAVGSRRPEPLDAREVPERLGA